MARYGSGGKYWNLGLSDFGRLGATQRQLWQLRKLTGEDHRGRGLTRDEASDLIREAIRLKEERRRGLTTMEDAMIGAAFSKAIEEANKAGDAWMAAHPEPLFSIADPETGTEIRVHGAIGKAWITWPAASSKFHKWLIENMYDGRKKAVPIPHRYAERVEGGLAFACEKAAIEALRAGMVNHGDLRLIYQGEEGRLPEIHAA